MLTVAPDLTLPFLVRVRSEQEEDEEDGLLLFIFNAISHDHHLGWLMV